MKKKWPDNLKETFLTKYVSFEDKISAKDKEKEIEKKDIPVTNLINN